MPPMVAVSRANSAGARHVPSRRALAVRPIIHGRPGPRQQEHRHPLAVVQQVGREHVEERRGHRDAGVDETAHEPQHAGAGHEQDRPQPQALGHPHGDTELVEDPEPRAHGPEVPDVLMGDPARTDRRLPHVGHPGQPPGRIDREVGLRVAPDLAGVREQEWDVGQQRERGDRQPGPDAAPARVGESGHGGVILASLEAQRPDTTRGSARHPRTGPGNGHRHPRPARPYHRRRHADDQASPSHPGHRRAEGPGRVRGRRAPRRLRHRSHVPQLRRGRCWPVSTSVSRSSSPSPPTCSAARS